MSRPADRSTLPLVPASNRPVTPSRLLVPALSLTLLLSWGSLYYGFAVLLPALQAELHWSPAWAMGAYSTALVVWGLCAYPVGRLIDRHGGRWAMTLGSCLSGLLFAALSRTDSLWAFYLVWAGLGVCMALTLYEPAFAVLVDAWPQAYRRRLGVLTLAGGLASTAFWPLTQLLVDALGWRGTLLVFAAIHLCICAPLHGLLVPATATPRSGAPRSAVRADLGGSAFRLLAFSFTAFGFVTSAMAVHVLPMLASTGATPAAALAIAALIGPMQVAGRSADLLLTGRLHPFAVGVLTVALIPLALAALWAATSTSALLYAFAVFYGVGLGLLTLVRATTPVELFGAAGYATLSGALSGPSVLARGAGPLAGTLIAMHHPYDTVLLVLLVCASGGAAAYLLVIRRGAAARNK